MTQSGIAAANVKAAQQLLMKNDQFKPVLLALSKRDRTRGDINVTTFSHNAARTFGVEVEREAAHAVFQILKDNGLGRVYRDKKMHVMFSSFVDIVEVAALLLDKKNSEGQTLSELVRTKESIPFVARRMVPQAQPISAGHIPDGQPTTNINPQLPVLLNQFFDMVDMSKLMGSIGSDAAKMLMDIYKETHNK